MGTVTLLNAARDYWANGEAHLFYHVSTDEVYGSLEQGGFFTETTPYDPKSPYSASKAGSDHFVRAYGNTYDLPYATEYTTNGTPTFPTINGVTNTFGSSKYYAHEIGTDETDVNGNFVAAITSSIQSGDFDIDQRGFAGDGELIMRVSRFIPDFQNLQGNAKVTLLLKDYPSETEASSPLGPFTISTSTDKIDTRARGRLMSVKIENDSQGEAWRYGTLRLDIHAGGRR